MTKSVLRALFALIVAATAIPGEAQAQVGTKGAAPPKSDEASEHFRSGVAFYKDRDFTAALVEFKRAYELAPNYRVLYNLGQTARELRDYAAALTAFERYLYEGGQEVPPSRRKDVQASVDDLKRKVGKIKVSVNVSGAEISIDDTPVGTSPLADAVVVNVGRHKFAATLNGYTPVQRMVEVAGSAEASVTLDLVKVDQPVIAAPDLPKNPPPPVKTVTPLSVWAMLGVTGASAIATGVMGGLALSARSNLNAALATFPGDEKAISDAQGKTRSFALGTDIAAGIALAGAVTTVVLFVVVPRTPEKAAPAVSIGVSPSGVVVNGVF